MGFTNQERINLNSKALAAKVLDANEIAQWYESRFPFEFVLDAKKVWTEGDALRAAPAANVTVARANASGSLSGIIEDKSQPADAVRLTPVPGTNNSTYVAYETFNDPSSERVDNWLQPQQIPQSNGAPSIGYSVALYDGHPSTSGTLVTTTDGQTGTGVNKSVGWVWDYGNGLLFLSDDFRDTLTYDDVWVLGFRYIGNTAADISGSSGSEGAPDDAQYVVLQPDVDLPNARQLVTGSGINITDNGSTVEVSVDAGYINSLQVWNEVPSGNADGFNTSFSLANTPSGSNTLMLFVNGVLQCEDGDYTLTGTTISMAYSPRSGSNILATYPRLS